MDVSGVLKHLGLEFYLPAFLREKITLDIICKLSLYDFECLGLKDRSKIMNLRTMCVKYGNVKPVLVNREFYIPKMTLESLLEIGFTVKDVSNMFNISESTVYRRMKKYNLCKSEFSEITDDQLDVIVLRTVMEFPHCGETMLREILLQQNLKVQRYRLRDCLHRIDETGIKERKKSRLHRRVYHVDSPNQLWHIDTNHKLIRWNFVIAGGIDGFSRLVTFLECTDNNKSETLLDCFLRGVDTFGLPSRVRSDMGLENTLIADFMIQNRGANRGSMITGKSTHNQRIERLWRDVYAGVLSFYYELFFHMEDLGILDHLNNLHITALHHVFLHNINEKLRIWRLAWANHRLRTVHSSPFQMFTAGVFNEHVDPTSVDLEAYGVEREGTRDVTEEEIDDNPRPEFVSPSGLLSQRCRRELNEQCPPNLVSQNNGIDIYNKAIHIITHFNVEN